MGQRGVPVARKLDKRTLLAIAGTLAVALLLLTPNLVLAARGGEPGPNEDCAGYCPMGNHNGHGYGTSPGGQGRSNTAPYNGNSASNDG